jgi:hypothetical protein
VSAVDPRLEERGDRLARGRHIGAALQTGERLVERRLRGAGLLMEPGVGIEPTTT